MNRSPDEIFAAQFWGWPDPAIKRDAHGRVLFVNAAFLQLFGGTVEAWQGQTVQGWSAPQPGPAPARFEIRTPAQAGQPEQVFDWLEMCGPDGTGFALARNVSAFAAPSAPMTNPADPVDAAPVFDSAHHSVQQQAAPAHAAHNQTGAHHAPLAEGPAHAPALPSAPPAEAPQAQAITSPPPTAQSEAPAAHFDAPQAAPLAAPPETHAPVHQSVAPPPAAQEIVPAAPLAAPPRAEPATQPAAVFDAQPAQHTTHNEEAPREFNRRALPIENDEAVLGNNWRDAVIAKAVGGEDSGDDLVSNLMAPNEPTPKASANAIRILLAEDNAINALLTRTLLEADGHTVETVEDGVLAVEAMKTQNYDMIFMDMRMPNMDGLEATRKIRALPNVSQDLPIVALTANAFDDDRNACFDSGMNDFMTKPVSAEELSEMVVRWTAKVPEEQRLAG